MARRLDDTRLAVMMLEGLEIAGRVHVVAVGISTERGKIPLGLWEGSTENATLARSVASSPCTGRRAAGPSTGRADRVQRLTAR